LSKTLGLVMIVKNEERTLPRLAQSLQGQLDRWTIVDTGSSDSTKEVAQELFGDLPGELIEDEWRGYGPSRNVALRAARGHTDWLVTLDADETVAGDLRADLDSADADVIEARQEYGILRFWLPRVIRSAAPWRWEGRAHEYLTLGDARPRAVRSDAFRVVHHADGGNRPDKLERELHLLEADLEEMPDDPRTTFYVARTHEDMGSDGPAAEFYRRRTELAGWDEERWYAGWRLGTCLLRLGRHDEASGVLLNAWNERPWRVEPLYSLATHYREHGQWQLCWEMGLLAAKHTACRPDGRGPAPVDDRLFVHEDAYRWGMAYERSVSAWHVGEVTKGRRLCEYLLGEQLPPHIRQSVMTNQSFYAPEHGRPKSRGRLG
jgi:glycosyltransferase involved in cell wall biosynthesis